MEAAMQAPLIMSGGNAGNGRAYNEEKQLRCQVLDGAPAALAAATRQGPAPARRCGCAGSRWRGSPAGKRPHPGLAPTAAARTGVCGSCIQTADY